MAMTMPTPSRRCTPAASPHASDAPTGQSADGQALRRKTAVMRAALPGSAPPHASPRRQRGVPRSGRRARRRRRDRRGRRGGALQPAQARQGAGPLLDLGAARAGGALVPARGRPEPARPRRGRLLLRPRARAADAGADLTADEWEGLRTLFARRAPRFLPPRCPGSTRPRALRRPPRGARRVAPTSPRRMRPCAVLVARRPRRAHLAPGRALRRGRLARGPRHARSCRTRSGCSTRSSPTHLGFRRSSRRVQGHGDGVLRGARATSTSSRARPRDAATAASSPSRSTGRASPRGSPRAATTGRPATPTSLLACRRAWRRSCSSSPRGCTSGPASAPDDGRRRRAQLRRQHAPLARGPVRRRLGAAGVRRQRDGARGGAARRRRARRRGRADARPPRSGRGWNDDELAGWLRRRRRRRTSAPPTSPTRSPRCSPPTASSRGSRAAASSARGRSGTARLLADPRRAEQPRAPQRRQGPRAVPAGGADGARRARAAEIFDGPPAEPVHALHPPGARPRGATRIPAVVHVDGTARIQTVDRADEPLVARMLEASSERTGRARRRQHVASTPPGARWSTTRATRWSASARRRSTCSRSGPSSCAAPARRAAWTARRTSRRGGDRPTFDVVVPTVGPPVAGRAARRAGAPRAAARGVIVVDDRRRRRRRSTSRRRRERSCAGAARGPAAARNAGWRARAAPWVAFLDDDVAPARAAGAPALAARPRRALPPASPRARAASTSRCPRGRRPTDWERNVAGLAATRAGRRPTWPTGATRWRRSAASTSASRAPTARTPTSALRLARRGLAASSAARARVVHPVGPAGRWSQRAQAGGQRRRRAHARAARPPAGASAPARRAGACAGTCATTAAAALRARGRWPRVAGARPARPPAAWARRDGASWPGARIAPGPRTRDEVATMLATSARHAVRRDWHCAALAGCAAPAGARRAPRRAVGRRASTRCCSTATARWSSTCPTTATPSGSSRCPGARAALDRLRARGRPLAVVSQPERHRPRPADAERGRARERARRGRCSARSAPWLVCPHGPDDGCACRKPAPGLVLAAAARLGVAPERCAVVGDIGADVEAARAAGARAVLVPDRAARCRDEVARRARAWRRDLGAARRPAARGAPR